MPRKQFYEKWEYRLWLANKRVGDLHPSSRGIWADWLSNMMEDDTYWLTGNLDDFAKWGRCTKAQALAALKDLAEHETADIEIEYVTQNVTHFVRNLSAKSFPIVTVVSRKRKKELKRRLDNRLRKQKERSSHTGHVESHAPYSKSKSNLDTKVSKSRRRPPSLPKSDFQKLMDLHGERIGVITDAAAQGKAIKELLQKFSFADCELYYHYQVKQLRSNGGWRDSVTWLTVQKYISEWIAAGRPTEPLEKKNGNHFHGPSPAAIVGKSDYVEEDFPECASCNNTQFLNGDWKSQQPCPDCQLEKAA